MERLRKEVLKVMENELKRANEKFPLFNSGHEGISVIREELMESYEEIDGLTSVTEDLERAVFRNKPAKDLHAIAKQGVIASLCAACELIQTAAMFNKFRTSLDQKKAEDEKESEFMQIPQDEINRMVEEMCGGEDDGVVVKRKCLRVTPKQAAKIINILETLEDEVEDME